jgi:hypothetical protein
LEQEAIEYVVRSVSSTSRRPPVTNLGRPISESSEVLALFVPADEADRAREILADLQNETGPAQVSGTTASATGGSQPTGIAAILLLDAERGTFIGRVSEAQLEILLDHLEQESEQDRSYYIDAATIDMLAGAGADETLVTLLRGALAGREGVEVRWSDES